MCIRRSPILLLFLALLAFPAWSQTRQELEEKRKHLLQEIEQLSLELSATQQDKKSTLSRYLSLQNQIWAREQLILTLREEIDYATASIQRSTDVVDALQQDLERLRSEYGQVLRIAFRHNINRSFVLFLLSSRNFNEAFQRWQYIRQYEKYRRRQAILIEETQLKLEERIVILSQIKADKQLLLADAETQQLTLDRDLKAKNSLLSSLRNDERQLAQQLATQQAARRELDKAIEAVIRTEIAASKKESGSSASAAKNAALVKLSSDFNENKGRLPWPVSDGEIVAFFGTHPHPTLKEVKIANNGIDIRSAPSAPVQAIFSGKAVSTSYIPNYKNTIIVQHGDYYTVYSNLETVAVRRGEEVARGKVLGSLGTNDSKLHFELWKGKERMNPQHWIVQD